MMLTSISEINSYLSCERKWKFSGRNGMFLRPTEDIPAYNTGKAFHEALDKMYQGKKWDIEEIIKENNVQEKDVDMLKFQVEKYYEEVYLEDKEYMEVIDTELKFDLPLNSKVMLHGYIDLIYVDQRDNTINIMEHKFMRNFRSDIYDKLDTQIKMYEFAVKNFFPQFTFGGVYLNQVRKLKTKTDRKRTKHNMTVNQLILFIETLERATSEMLSIDNIAYAEPDFMKCGFCEYRGLCAKMQDEGTNDINIITEEDIAKENLRSVR